MTQPTKKFVYSHEPARGWWNDYGRRSLAHPANSAERPAAAHAHTNPENKPKDKSGSSPHDKDNPPKSS